jgi:tRNA A37 threonylcarbamoyladenosine biosynthesis protein TsaE
MKIEPTVYTLDDGLTYHIDFYRTKDNISFEHYKTVKYLKLTDLYRLRENIDKIVIKYKHE